MAVQTFAAGEKDYIPKLNLMSQQSGEAAQAKADAEQAVTDAGVIKSDTATLKADTQALRDQAGATAIGDFTGAIRFGKLDNPLCSILKKNKLVDTLSGALSWTRATTATYIDRYGVLKTAAIDEPREEKDGWLIEGVSTNLCLHSEDATQGYWNKLGFTASLTTDPFHPNGSVFRLTEDTGNTQRRLRRSTTTVSAGGIKTLSLFVKPDNNRTGVSLAFQGFGGVYIADFDLSTQTFTESAADLSSQSASIKTLSDGWFRLSISAESANPVSNLDTLIFFSNTPTDGNAPYTGDGTSGVLMTGIQIEELPFASSYIPTTDVAVTRATDVVNCSAQNAGLIGQEFSISFRASFFGIPNTYPRIVELSGGKMITSISADGASNIRVNFDATGRGSGVAKALDTHTAYAICMNSTDAGDAVYIDGVKGVTVATGAKSREMDPDAKILIFSNSQNGGGSRVNFGHIQDLCFRDFALNPDEITYLAGE